MQGYVQVYTGDGKGKTTAALGLILRAAGAGLRIYLGQFIKKGRFSEIRTLADRFPDVTIEQYGRGRFVRGAPSPEDIAAAREGLDRLRRAMLDKAYDIVIADEINTAVDIGLFPVADLLMLLEDRPPEVELVLTGRHAPPALIERADLVTDMTCIKHYHAAGTAARPGIEC